VAKLYAYWITVNYREAYGMYACNGILFNHESPRRGETFVSRKITRGLCNISQGLDKCLYMGNIDAKRDWGHARDYVEMQWLMLQQEEAKDFVIATGQQTSVRDFIVRSAQNLGIALRFEGTGTDEVGIVESIDASKADPGMTINVGDNIVAIDPRYYRPTEVETLLGDPSYAKSQLGWEPSTSLDEMIEEMVVTDLEIARKDRLLLDSGYEVAQAHE
jgi:GDPmannose 4,6-dehydratase